jgi:hypothetical protein
MPSNIALLETKPMRGAGAVLRCEEAQHAPIKEMGFSPFVNHFRMALATFSNLASIGPLQRCQIQAAACPF